MAANYGSLLLIFTKIPLKEILQDSYITKNLLKTVVTLEHRIPLAEGESKISWLVWYVFYF